MWTSSKGNDKNEIVLYKEQAEVVKLIFELYSLDQSLSKISEYLEIYRIPSQNNKALWGRQIINNVLLNENYIGNIDYPKIITDELWDSAQNKKNNNSYSMRYSKNK